MLAYLGEGVVVLLSSREQSPKNNLNYHEKLKTSTQSSSGKQVSIGG